MKKILKFAFICGLGLSLAACGDKAKSPDEPDKPSGSMEELTPAESKEKLETAAKEFLGKFKAGDQQEFIEFCAFFGEEYGDLDAPAEFEVDEDVDDVNPGYFLRALASAMETGNVTRATNATITYTYSLDFEKWKGLYVPGINRWVKKSDSNDIIFQFNDANQNLCELKATLSGGNSDGSFTVTDEYYDWYYEEEVTENNVYKYKIPKNIKVTLTNGSNKTLATAIVNSDINVSGHKFKVDASVEVANVIAAATIDGSDTKVTENCSLTVSKEELLATTATITGNNLCNLDNYLTYEDMDDDELAEEMLKLFETGSAVVSVMKNQVRVDASMKYNRDVYKAITTSYNDKSDIEKACAVLDNNITAEVSFDNTKTVQANLVWGYVSDYGYYDFEPLLKFEKDGTTYSFEDYFSKGFSSVESAWESLIDNYERVWKNAQK